MVSSEQVPVPNEANAFSERFRIDTSKPLPEFSTPGGDAYMVVDAEHPDRAYYALVHNPAISVRNTVFKYLSDDPVASLICPIERGLMNVDLPGGLKQRLVTIFERPTGGALLGPKGEVHPKLNTGRLRQSIALQLLKALAGLHKRGVYHRCIRPTAIYFANKEGEDIVLGECYSTPAGYKQPMGLEPLELAFAQEAGRGQGSEAADYYQLGATLQCLYFGEMLWSGRDRDSLLTARVNQGSFWALSGGRDVPGTLGVLLRGLMADEPEARWIAADVIGWYEGNTAPKRTPMKSWAMNRPSKFEGTAYVDRRLLADAFGRNPLAAAKFLRKLDFPMWVQQSLRDVIFTEKLDRALAVRPGDTMGAGRNAEFEMVARVCMFLDPTGPVRYKSLSLFLDAFPAVVADAFARDDKDALAALDELLDSAFIATLVDIAADKSGRLHGHSTALRKYFDMSSSRQLGKGMERVLYELNSALPCQSSRFKSVWIGSVRQLIMALDRLAGAGGGDTAMYDRHIAAFCAVHGLDLERYINQMAAAQGDPARFNTIVAEFFGTLQAQLKIPSLPNLTAKVTQGLGAAIKKLRSKSRREAVEKLVEKVKKSGDIARLVREVNVSRLSHEDAAEFAQARQAMIQIERDRMRLARKMTAADPEAQQKGLKVARLIATALAVFGLTLVIL